MKYCLVLISALLVVGCSQYRTLVGEEGRKAADAALHDSIWVVCDVATEGSIKRQFSAREERDVYDAFCDMARQ